MSDTQKSTDRSTGSLGLTTATGEALQVQGRYTAVCRDAEGRVLWSEEFDNLVTALGRNLLLDTTLSGSAYTVTGPFMGLISSAGYTAVAASDTMASHSGWTEAGGTNAPTYVARKTIAWAAASGGSKASSAIAAFTFTGAGTVKGSFICLGSGATTTVDNTGGTLYSAGLFSDGDKTVAATNTLTVTYSGTIT